MNTAKTFYIAAALFALAAVLNFTLFILMVMD